MPYYQGVGAFSCEYPIQGQIFCGVLDSIIYFYNPANPIECKIIFEL